MIYDSNTSLKKLEDFFSKSSNLTEIDIPELINVNDNSKADYNGIVLLDTNAVSIKFPNIQQQISFLGNEKLEEVNLDSLQYIENQDGFLHGHSFFPVQFLHNTKLESLRLPNLLGARSPIPNSTVSPDEQQAMRASFQNNYWLRDVAIGENVNILNHNANTNQFNGLWFRNNYSLKFLRLYNPYVLIPNRALTTGLGSTPIGSGNGHIYVPKELVEDYKADTNWSTYASFIRPMEDYATDKALDKDSITNDIKTWEQIINDCNSTSELDTNIYKVGATKTIKIDGIPTQMVIVGINKDIDINSNPVRLTWMSKTITYFNTIPCSALNTGTPRNYAGTKTAVQNFLQALYYQINQTVRDGIKTVQKESYGYDSNDIGGNIISNEQIWIPSAEEIGLAAHGNNTFAKRYEYFTNNSNANDYKLGETNIRPVGGVATRDYSSASAYYLDTIQYNNSLVSVIPNSASNPYIIFGFCT